MKRITVEIKDDEKFIGYYTIDKNGLNEYHPCKEVSASKVEDEDECGDNFFEMLNYLASEHVCNVNGEELKVMG